MNKFIISKLECMAIRRQEWLFDIMLLDHEKLDELGFDDQAKKVVEEQNKKERKKWFGRKRFLLYDDAIRQICDLPENRKIIQSEKEKIKKKISRYKLISETDKGMYEKNEIIIQDTITLKFYQGWCDNYGGANWPPVTFTEIINRFI